MHLHKIRMENISLFHLIPLFHTGHESPESPRIDFFLTRGGGGGGIREVSLNYFLQS